MAATTNGIPTSANILDEVAAKVPPGTVLPPRNQRDIIEKSAGYIVRNGLAFEEKLRSSGKVPWVVPEDPYHAYYRWRVDEIKEGRGTAIAAGRKEGEQVSFQGREERKGPEKPEEFQFSARMPNISAQDLEVVRLTALFVAKNGRSWMTTLSQREAGNFQFDFLRPQHSLYQFFSRLVDQYTDLLNGDSIDSGRPQKKRILDLEANVTDRFRILEKAKKRAEWVKYQEAQKVEKEEQAEKEKVAYAQIDWHEFTVVDTVIFDEKDEEIELPAPATLNDIQSRSLEQKGMFSVGSDMRLEEAMPTFDDYDQFYGQPAPTPVQQMPPPPQQAYVPTPPQPQQQQFQPPPEISEESRISTLQADRARARAAQDAARSSAQQVKIRKDYIPAAQARKTASAGGTSICPNCKQEIPNAEMENHLRIEMLSPDWRDQYRIQQQRSSTTNLAPADMAANLKRLASQRSDVFDPSVAGGGQVGPEEEERRRKVERRAYDGVSSAALGQMAGMGPQGKSNPGGGGGQEGGKEVVDVQEQIRLIREKAAKNG